MYFREQFNWCQKTGKAEATAPSEILMPKDPSARKTNPQSPLQRTEILTHKTSATTPKTKDRGQLLTSLRGPETRPDDSQSDAAF